MESVLFAFFFFSFLMNYMMNTIIFKSINFFKMFQYWLYEEFRKISDFAVFQWEYYGVAY